MPQPEFTLEPVDHDPFAPSPLTYGDSAARFLAPALRNYLSVPPASPSMTPNAAGKVPSADDASSRLPGAIVDTLGLASMMAPGGAGERGAGFFQKALTSEAPAVESKLAVATAPKTTFFHASPHDFSQFDSSKIGTGEGAQAYGHGLYVAENPDVAREYRKQFQQRYGKAITYEGTINANPDHFLHWDKPLTEQSDHVQKAIDKLDIPHMDDGDVYTGEDVHSDLASWHHVDIEEDPTWQDHFQGKYKDLTEHQEVLPSHAKLQLAQEAEGEAQKRAAEQLKEAGIAGIKYMDRDSKTNALAISNAEKSIKRSQAAIAGGKPVSDAGAIHDQVINSASKRLEYLRGQPLTHNYVIFNDKALEIAKKYGMAGLIAQGAAHFTTTQTDEDPFNAHSTAAEPAAP